ncbi:hypothetical protein [Paenibacillus solani]
MSKEMITLKMLNVVKQVESEAKAKALESKGFKRVGVDETDGKKGKKDDK